VEGLSESNLFALLIVAQFVTAIAASERIVVTVVTERRLGRSFMKAVIEGYEFALYPRSVHPRQLGLALALDRLDLFGRQLGQSQVINRRMATSARDRAGSFTLSGPLAVATDTLAMRCFTECDFCRSGLGRRAVTATAAILVSRLGDERLLLFVVTRVMATLTLVGSEHVAIM